MHLPSSRRTTQHDRDREHVLLGIDDGSALSGFFTELRSELAAVPDVTPNAAVSQYLKDGYHSVDPRLIDTQPIPVVEGLSLTSRSQSQRSTSRPTLALVGVVLALVAVGSFALRDAVSRTATREESVAAEDGQSQIRHNEEGTSAMISLGLAGSITVDVESGQAALSYPNPTGGWIVTNKSDDCTELTLSRNDGEAITVSLVFENSAIWVDIADQQTNEVKRVFFADHATSGADPNQNPGPNDHARPNPGPTERSGPEASGPSSGVPAGRDAPAGGDTSTTTTQADTPTLNARPGSTTTARPTTTTTQAPGDDDDDDDDDDDLGDDDLEDG